MTLTPQQSIQTIKNVLAGDNSKDNSTAGANSILKSINSNNEYDRRQNSINAVTDLLKGFLDTTSMEIIKAEGKQTSNIARSLSDNAAGFGSKVNSKYLPSYNVRTPIVEITINGYPIYPDKRVLGNTSGPTVRKSRLNFQSFNLKLPMGGPEKSVTGTLVLFSKNPEEILGCTESWATQADADKTMDGLPMMTLKFGWAFSDSTKSGGDSPVQVNTTSAMSPQMNFIITNIAMEDPGTAGTTFTFTLQELGTVVLQNSSNNLIIASDYPQQQLRVLLEGIMRVRLFTLDDILYLGQKNQELLKTALKTSDLSLINGLLNPISDITKKPTLTDTQEYTFFTNTESADIGINNRNFETVANELASQCRCKWYPHRNDDKGADSTLSSGAADKITKLSTDLNMIKSMAPGTELTVEQTQELLKTLGPDASEEANNYKNSTQRMSANTAIQHIESARRANLARLSARCRLIWVSNVPADWNTTGSVFYTTSKNTNDQTSSPPEPYREGAYFLLPDILDDFDIFTQDLPLCYGSGASSLPYFYGSGQNVFQTSLGNIQPEMFGEVLSLSTNHNNLITQLASSIKEEMAYAVEGKRIYGIKAADQIGTIRAKKTATKVKGDPHQATEAEQKAMEVKINGIITKSKQEIYAGGIRSKISSGGMRMNSSLALGSQNLLLGDHPSLLGHDKSSAITDAEGPVQTASLRIRTRIANFLRFPTATKITVLGDPNLLRLGPGCFELFSYYPVEDDNGVVTQELNALTSGVYFVQSIEHNITMGDFTTTLNGTKAVDPINVPSSITTQILNKLEAEQLDENILKLQNQVNEGTNPANKITATQVSQALSAQFASVNLNSVDFTTGTLATQLKNALSTYKTLPT